MNGAQERDERQVVGRSPCFRHAKDVLKMESYSSVKTLDDLKAYLVRLFGTPMEFSEMSDCQVMSFFEGKIKTVLAMLQEKTGREGWTGEASFYHYGNDALDINIGIGSVPGGVLVIASIDSRYRETLRPYGG